MMTFACPQCEKALRADESRARSRARCPACGHTFTISEAAGELPPAGAEGETRISASPIRAVSPAPRPDGDEPEPDEEQERRRRRKQRRLHERREGLANVNIGLACHYARLLVLIVTIIGRLVWVVLTLAAIRHFLAMLQIGEMLLLLSSVVQAVLGIVGSIFCLFVPARSNARLIILISLLLDVLALPLVLIAFLIDFPEVVAMLLGLASWILFTLYMRRLATYLGERVTADQAEQILWRGLLLFVAAPVGLAGIGFALRYIPCIGPLFFLGLVLAYIIYVIKFLFKILDVLGSLRQVIVSREL
jgi:hypothetical protein